MRIEEIALADLKPYENNPRDNSGAVDALANSLAKFGWQQPIVIDKDNVIVCGHTRYLAARKIGMKKAPCKRAEDLSEEQIAAYRLADNKIAELSAWDFAKLDEELEKLEFGECDMRDFGFTFDNKGDEPDESDLFSESNFNYKEQYGVIVMCKDETEQEKVYNKLSEMGYECKVVAT